MLLYAVITGLIQFSLPLVQISDFAIRKRLLIITVPQPCYRVGVIQGVMLFHQLFTAFDRKTCNFDLSAQRTLTHCSIVYFSCILVHWSLFTLFCFLNSGFLTVILPYRTSSQSFLLTVNVHIFSRRWFNCEEYLMQWAFCHTNWWLINNSSS